MFSPSTKKDRSTNKKKGSAKKYEKSNKRKLSELEHPTGVPESLMNKVVYKTYTNPREVKDDEFTTLKEFLDLPFEFVNGVKIGSGNVGSVFGIVKKGTSERFALKIIPQENECYGTDEDYDNPSSNGAEREIAAQLALKERDNDKYTRNFAKMEYYFKMRSSELVKFYVNNPDTFMLKLYENPKGYKEDAPFNEFIENIETTKNSNNSMQDFEDLLETVHKMKETNHLNDATAVTVGEEYETVYYFIINELITDFDHTGPVSKPIEDFSIFKSTEEILEGFRQIVDTIVFLQENRIIHGDLYDRNVVLRRNSIDSNRRRLEGKEREFDMVFIDFGFSCGYPESYIEKVPEYSCIAPQSEWRESVDYIVYSFTLDPQTILLVFRNHLNSMSNMKEKGLLNTEVLLALFTIEYLKASSRLEREKRLETHLKKDIEGLIHEKIKNAMPDEFKTFDKNWWDDFSHSIELTIMEATSRSVSIKIINESAKRLSYSVELALERMARKFESEKGKEVTIPSRLLISITSIIDSILKNTVNPEKKYAKIIGEPYNAEILKYNLMDFYKNMNIYYPSQ